MWYNFPFANLRMRCATFPCGCDEIRNDVGIEQVAASEINRIGGQITDGWKVFPERRQCRNTANKRLGGSRFNIQSVALLFA